MANVAGKIDEIQAKVKAELAAFMANQEIMLNLRGKLASIKSVKPEVYAQLKATYDKLYARQADTETKAIDWMKRIAELKTLITSNPDITDALSGKISPAIFSGDFWSQITAYTNQALPLINEGLGLSSVLVTQNGDVALLKKSVEQGVVYVPTRQTAALNQGLIWAYGLIGLGLAYVVARGKRRSK